MDIDAIWDGPEIVLSGALRTQQVSRHTLTPRDKPAALADALQQMDASDPIIRQLKSDGNTAVARAALEQRIKKKPDDATAHYDLGCILTIDGDLPDAMSQLLDTQRSKPGLALQRQIQRQQRRVCDLWQQRADSDDLAAMGALGAAYEHGWGVTADAQEAKALVHATPAMRATPRPCAASPPCTSKGKERPFLPTEANEWVPHRGAGLVSQIRRHKAFRVKTMAIHPRSGGHRPRSGAGALLRGRCGGAQCGATEYQDWIAHHKRPQLHERGPATLNMVRHAVPLKLAITGIEHEDQIPSQPSLPVEMVHCREVTTEGRLPGFEHDGLSGNTEFGAAPLPALTMERLDQLLAALPDDGGTCRHRIAGCSSGQPWATRRSSRSSMIAAVCRRSWRRSFVWSGCASVLCPPVPAGQRDRCGWLWRSGIPRPLPGWETNTLQRATSEPAILGTHDA